MSWIPFLLVVAALGNFWHCEACPKGHPATTTTGSTTASHIAETTSPSKAPTTSTSPPTTESTPSTVLTTEISVTSTDAVNNSCRCPPLTQYTESAPVWAPIHGNLSIRETIDDDGCSQMTVTCTAEGNFEVYMYASFKIDILITPTGTGQGPLDNCGVMNVMTGFEDVPLVCKDGAWYYVDMEKRSNLLPSVGCVYTNEVPCGTEDAT